MLSGTTQDDTRVWFLFRWRARRVQKASCFAFGSKLYGYVGKYCRSQSPNTDFCGVDNLGMLLKVRPSNPLHVLS